MSLRTITYKYKYRTGEADPVEQFYIPSLQKAAKYYRSVGYFSSTALEVLGAPMGEFFERGGTMRLITSVALSQNDIDAIAQGLNIEKAYADALLRKICEDFSKPVGKGTILLAALLEVGRLEIRIAKPVGRHGIYHEKLGLFIDEDDDYVVFDGSINESRFAFEQMFEASGVHTSWQDPLRTKDDKDYFERLWANLQPGIEVLTFPEAAKKNIIDPVRETDFFKFLLEKSPRKAVPLTNKLWVHQERAIEQFLLKKCGILEMATGSGKTRTALEIAERLISNGDINSGLIVSDGVDLLAQWAHNLRSFQFSTLNPFRILEHFSKFHDIDKYTLDPSRSFLVVSWNSLPKVLEQLSEQQMQSTLLIVDEVHGFGSPGNITALNGKLASFKYRLGLSATPERAYDEDGNFFIEKSIGPVVFQYDLKNAIEDKILCEFDYYPLAYEISPQDKERLQKLLRRKAIVENLNQDFDLKDILIQIAKVFKTSRSKLPIFKNFIANHRELLSRSIIFVEDRKFGDEVLDLIHPLTHEFHTYYADDDRENLLRFSRGDIQCLITCHRLSEGIDIQSVKSIILFSSDKSQLETIQRIGRSLRIDSNDPTKVAAVVDFIRESSGAPDTENADEIRRNWLTKLSRTSKNGKL